VPRIETFVLHPSSPELFTWAKWRVEAFADLLENEWNSKGEEVLLEALSIAGACFCTIAYLQNCSIFIGYNTWRGTPP
jgi:hypothetical protein